MKYRLSISAVAGLLSFAVRAAAQQWVQTTSLPDGYAEQSLVYASGFLYQTGGASDSNAELDGTNVFYAQVSTNGTIGPWKNTTPLPEAVFEHGGVTANGFVYVLGGVHYNATNGDFVSAVVNYVKVNPDGSLDSWQMANPLPQALFYPVASVWNNTIYVTGDTTAAAPVNTVYSAGIQNNGSLSTWRTNAPLPDSIYAHGGAANGILYTLGGVNHGGTSLTSAVNYSRINAEGMLAGWKQTTPLPHELGNVEAVAAGGRIFIIGGWNGSTYINGFYSAPVAGDGTVGTWVAGPALPQMVGDEGVAITGSYIFVSGGVGDSANSSEVYSMALPAPPVAPKLVASSFTNGNSQLQLTSATNTGFGLLASANLTSWTNIGWGFTDTNGSLLFQDTNAAGFPNRFYRAYWPLP